MPRHTNLHQDPLFVVTSKTTNWLDLDSYRQIKKDSMPEFFKYYYSSKMPQTYMEYRDFMIAL